MKANEVGKIAGRLPHYGEALAELPPDYDARATQAIDTWRREHYTALFELEASTIIRDYPALAARSAARLDPDAALIDGALGLCGEVGELLDIVVNGGSTLRRRDELGDCYWYAVSRWLPALDFLGSNFLASASYCDAPKPRCSDTEAAC